MTSLSLTVLGTPVGKGRPKFGNGRVFTPHKTVVAEQAIRAAWETGGSPRLPDGPVQLTVTMILERPRGHFKKDGSFSAEGNRHPWPASKKPDVDNALKLVMDALNSLAWRDDVQVVSASVSRHWGVQARTEIFAKAVPA